MRNGLTALALAGALGLGGCGLGTESDANAPVIEITSPRIQPVRATVDFSATVLDESPIAWVRFMVDGQLLFEDTAAPYTTRWQTTAVSDGAHILTVEARDASGNQASRSIEVTVSNAPPN